MLPKPTDIGPWDIQSLTHQESGSVIASSEVLRQAEPRQIYEIWSFRMTMTEDGTGDLASMGIGTAFFPQGSTNSDNLLVSLRTELKIGGLDPGNVWWHMGRSNQLGQGIGGPDIYFPPDFWWDGPVFGYFQNGAGATIDYLWTIVYRVLTFTQRDWTLAVNSSLPRRGRKHRTFTV